MNGQSARTKIKICGLRRRSDIETVNTVRPDYAGFILAPPFWRYVSPETVRELRRELAPGIRAVGVFVNQEPEHIAGLLRDGTIDIAQLHGQETNGMIDEIRSLAGEGAEIWKAIKVTSEADLQTARESHADMVLLDGGTGTGERFDWALLQDVGRAFFLAGGLGPDNVRSAIGQVHPYGVDVSSGVETEKVKDAEKIRRFVSETRAAESL